MQRAVGGQEREESELRKFSPSVQSYIPVQSSKFRPVLKTFAQSPWISPVPAERAAEQVEALIRNKRDMESEVLCSVDGRGK